MLHRWVNAGMRIGTPQPRTGNLFFGGARGVAARVTSHGIAVPALRAFGGAHGSVYRETCAIVVGSSVSEVTSLYG